MVPKLHLLRIIPIIGSLPHCSTFMTSHNFHPNASNITRPTRNKGRIRIYDRANGTAKEEMRMQDRNRKIAMEKKKKRSSDGIALPVLLKRQRRSGKVGEERLRTPPPSSQTLARQCDRGRREVKNGVSLAVYIAPCASFVRFERYTRERERERVWKRNPRRHS